MKLPPLVPALALAAGLCACQMPGGIPASARRPALVPSAAEATPATPNDRWAEGRFGVDPTGRAALFCRTESGDFLALAPQGHPLLGSQGSRAHTEQYLDGENVWRSTFTPGPTLNDLWLRSDHAGGRAFDTAGLASLARAAGGAGPDKRKHFEVSYGLMLISRQGDDVLDNLLLGGFETLAIGIDKELRDRALTPAQREPIEAAMTRTAEDLRALLEQIRALRLDRGDLAADMAGLSYGAAVKAAQWLEAGAP